jgi:hypothetical protein
LINQISLICLTPVKEILLKLSKGPLEDSKINLRLKQDNLEFDLGKVDKFDLSKISKGLEH